MLPKKSLFANLQEKEPPMPRPISLIAIGDEVVCGMTYNTNSGWLAGELTKRGYTPVVHVVIPDDAEMISKTIHEQLLQQHDVITTGGLGPTLDDKSRRAASSLFRRPLIMHPELLATLREKWGEKTTLHDQATQPEGSTLLFNAVGTASGVILEDEHLFPNARLILLPGPPQEMQAVAQELFTQYFPSTASGPSKLIHLLNVTEQDVDPIARNLAAKFSHLHIGIYPAYGSISIFLSQPKDMPQLALEEATEIFTQKFRDFVFTEPSIEACLHTILKQNNWTIATAESCTAGAMATSIASLAGASNLLVGSIVAYQDKAKQTLLQVPESLMQHHGSVSIPVTQKMAEGAKILFGADVVCSTSGYFGPTAGHEAPVGRVFASFICPHGSQSHEFFFHGTRASIHDMAVHTILAHLVLFLRRPC